MKTFNRTWIIRGLLAAGAIWILYTASIML